MQCVLRALKQRCAPEDIDDERTGLYDEVLVLKKSANMYSKAYEMIDLNDLDGG
jgi:hypothetical protein